MSDTAHAYMQIARIVFLGPAENLRRLWSPAAHTGVRFFTIFLLMLPILVERLEIPMRSIELRKIVSNVLFERSM